MNYAPAFSLAADTERAYEHIQQFIASEAPAIEARIKLGAMKAAVGVLTVTLAVIDWAVERIDRRDEYRLRLMLAYVNTKRFAVRQTIRLVQFDERYRLTATATKIWARKGAIATSALDTIFALK